MRGWCDDEVGHLKGAAAWGVVDKEAKDCGQGPNCEGFNMVYLEGQTLSYEQITAEF